MYIRDDKTKGKRDHSETEGGGRFVCETGTEEHSRRAHEFADAIGETVLSPDFYQPIMLFDHSQPGELFH